MWLRFFATALVDLALAATSARATLVQTKVSSATELAYSADVSNSDLLTGKTATTTGWNLGNGSTTAELNDGIHGVTFAAAGNSVQGTWTTVGATAIYNLGLGANNLGFDLTSIQTIAAWVNVGFGNQAYSVDVKLKGAASYTTLATVDYQPLALNGIGATKVTLTDSTGVLASGVEFIRFTANSVNGGQNAGAFVFREIDVFGTPTGNTSTPLRIMCLGDSITAGYTDNPTWNHPFSFGYRSGLYTRLTNAGYHFKLVGGSTEPWTGISGDPTRGGTYTPALDLRDFAQDGHRGYGGQSIGGINGAVAGYIAADTPDVILLLIGINGIGSDSPAALNTLVNTIVTAAPNAHLIVAQITPLASFNQDLYNYNLYIRDTLVPTYAGNHKNVTTVNLYSLFLTNPNDYASAIAPNVLANDINHPDNPHYELMAQEWFNGIEALGLGPNTFKRWINSFPGVGTLTGFNDDPDGDGIPNGLENFFGTNPGIFSAGLVSRQVGDHTFTFTHPQNATPADDIAGPNYRWSKDLATFHAAGATDGDGTTVQFTAQPNTPTPGITTVTATVTGTPISKLFVTVGVTQN